MRFFRIAVADKIIGINSHFSRIYKICRDFLTECNPDFCVQCDMDDFDRAAESFSLIYNHEPPSNVFIEVYAVHEKVAEGLIDYGAFLFHGAVIAYNGSAYLFTALSGTGKTTHIMKWLDRLPDAFVVNGDKPFIKFNDDGSVWACGSPWAGKENMYTNTMMPLKAIILMERAEDNHIRPISFVEAFPRLLQQVYCPKGEEKMRKTLRLMQRLSPAVSFWLFQCNNLKDDCFDVAYNALVENIYEQD